MNASLFPERRQGYAVGEYQRKADQGFRELVCDEEISGGWVVGRVEEEGITRVDGKAGKTAALTTRKLERSPLKTRVVESPPIKKVEAEKLAEGGTAA